MSKSKTIEETYQKKTQHQHILDRPNTYIGSVKKIIDDLWILEKNVMVKKMIEYTSGLMKIFDEILVNAIDISVMHSEVTTIKVDIDPDTGKITIYNNGKNIPVVLHKELNIYVPEMILGNLLTSSNYDDNEKRIVGGVNGLGAKLTNIFSTEFNIEIVDEKEKLKYRQTFSNNMYSKTDPKITSNSGKSYTQISFIPDFKRFGMKSLEKNTIALMKKRVYDTIACTNKNVSVYLNGEKIKAKNFIDYCNFYDQEKKIIYEKLIEKGNYIWEIAVIPYDHYEQVSFVNGVCTIKGGKHVDTVLYQIISGLKTMIEQKKKIKNIKTGDIKERLFLFLRATVIKPDFDSQSKETLTTPSKDFGHKIEVSEKFIEKIYKSSIIDEIVELSKFKETRELAKTTDGTKKSKIYNVPKLEDAEWAGSKKSDQCTLMLTEGDSASTFAKWGRSVVGTERFGVFPLKGKPLNIRDASIKQLTDNTEMLYIKQILGLQQDRKYTDTSKLRYGKLLLLTDSDLDGSHIKTLIINVFHKWWPELLKLDFIQTLKTPIVKAIKGKTVIEFFTEQDYHKWKDSLNTSSYEIQYFKGLGTSRKEDAQSIFKRFDNLRVEYYHKDSKCDDAIILAFEKDKNIIKGSQTVNCADKRKQWLRQYDKDIYLDTNLKKIPFQDLINKEFIHFSIYDNIRSIPSMCDGLKPSQRKILYYMLKKNQTKKIKVAQLSGYVSAETGYHHGEMSLQGAIIGMAQNFIGTNNINLLYPDGNFGSRYDGGKDAASARYIFTRLEDAATEIFRSEDLPLLNYLKDDNEPIEPEYYIPIIPMILVNGAEGIGTGFSTFIPQYNPIDIIKNIKRLMKDREMKPMNPWFKNFSGEVQDLGDGQFATVGKWKRLDDTVLSITEIPVGSWVTNYKQFLESLIENGVGKKIKSNDNSTISSPTKKSISKIVLKDLDNKTKDENTAVNFHLTFRSKNELDALISSGNLEKELKLIKTFSTNNMYLFDSNLRLTKYANPSDIIKDFYKVRLALYSTRKDYLIKVYMKELNILDAKIRFINEYTEEIIVIHKKSKAEIIEQLFNRDYPTFLNESGKENYDYLVRMEIISLSKEKLDDLIKKQNNKKIQLEDLQSKTINNLWSEDLESLFETISDDVVESTS